ncbi:MAG: hypothetical protein K5821_15845 [Nitrobacter sp.]|nr:hypothetical protein [Nitrobacter sp.]MCV0387842.1 hypothetical protein [Nitrobacter sp.]
MAVGHGSFRSWLFGRQDELAWLPLAIFKRPPLSIWYDPSDVKLAEAL